MEDICGGCLQEITDIARKSRVYILTESLKLGTDIPAPYLIRQLLLKFAVPNPLSRAVNTDAPAPPIIRLVAPIAYPETERCQIMPFTGKIANVHIYFRIESRHNVSYFQTAVSEITVISLARNLRTK